MHADRSKDRSCVAERVREFMAADGKLRHHLGWQITGRCNRACRYCLRRRSDRPENELDPDSCRLILESYLEFLAANGLTGSIMYSGGNPMLREDLPALLERTGQAKADGLVDHVSILANPETITADTAAHLAGCKVDVVFISIDGRKENNDRMRGEGSFDAAVKAVPVLAAAGVRVNIKFTISRLNFREAPYVFDLALSLGAQSVGIGVMSRPDAAGDLSDLLISPDEYREHLLSVLAYDDAADEAKKELICSSVQFNRGLYALLYHESGRYADYRNLVRRTPASPLPPFARPGGDAGTLLRRGMFVVWEDGSVHRSNPHAYPVLGMVPDESFQTIHERRIAGGLDAHHPNDCQGVNLVNSVCESCPVRADCPGDFPCCWRLANSGNKRFAYYGPNQGYQDEDRSERASRF